MTSLSKFIQKINLLLYKYCFIQLKEVPIIFT